MATEEGRACIYELDLAAGSHAHLCRRPAQCRGHGLGAGRPGVLWTVVNERDGLGDETPPDYLTSVQAKAASTAGPTATGARRWTTACRRMRRWWRSALTPDYALGGHTASLGLCWMPAGTLPGFGDGMVIGQHGSWNRSTLSGYKVIFVPFADGRPTRARRATSSGAFWRRTNRCRTAARWA